ncbi:MAG: hypothetical protein DRP71_13770 [Verrucomicrobia bacterium]|nr:MAG: hypothetical protein DRP71_13770 [Verrucomicrobiota bacterium]
MKVMGKVGEVLCLDDLRDRGVKPLLQEEKWKISQSEEGFSGSHQFTCGAPQVQSTLLRR